MRQKLRLVSGLVVLAGAAGCVGILGDFETSGGDGGAGNDGGGTDGTTSNDGAVTPDGGNPDDGASPGDAAVDAPDASAFLLNCDGFKYPNPLPLDSLDDITGASRTFDDKIRVATVSDSVLVIATRRGGSGSYSWYTFNKQNTSSSGRFDQTLGDSVQEIKRSAGNATDILGTHYNQFGGSALDVITVPDTNAPGGALPPPFFISPNGTANGNNFNPSFVELAQGSDYFYAYTIEQDAGPTLFVGRAKGEAGAPSQVALPVYHGASPVLLHTAPTMRVIMSSDPTQDAGALLYTVSDNGNSAGGVAPRPLSGAKLGLLLDAVQNTQHYDMAFAEFDPTSTTALFTLRVGSIDATQFDTFKVSDLPLGPAFGDSTLLPIDHGTSKWALDEFAAIGKGSPATYKGLNFIALDANGHLRAELVGPNAVLKERANPITNVGISLGQKIAVRYVTWNIVWSETVHSTDGGADYDVLLMNELICH
jgi:hypothetical protein